jgi:hypothetical protein
MKLFPLRMRKRDQQALRNLGEWVRFFYTAKL